MMQRTKIEWCTHSWGVVSGCTKGCSYCYARKMAHRFGRSFEPTCHPERLAEPLKLKRPGRIFVDSAGDLFDPAIPGEFIDQVFAVMSLCQQHTFLVLTKQPKRMLEWFNEEWQPRTDYEGAAKTKRQGRVADASFDMSDPHNSEHWTPDGHIIALHHWPLPNVWLGVTCEHQAAADERIPLLLQTPAAVRFVSVEPLLGPIKLWPWLPIEADCNDQTLFEKIPWERCTEATLGQRPELLNTFHWCIIGNDSTPGARLPDPAWVESIIGQCRAAGVAIFVKGALAKWWPFQEMPEVRV